MDPLNFNPNSLFFNKHSVGHTGALSTNDVSVAGVVAVAVVVERRPHAPLVCLKLDGELANNGLIIVHGLGNGANDLL